MWAQPCHNYLNPLVRRRVRLWRVRQRTEQTKQGQEESRSVVWGGFWMASLTLVESILWPTASGLRVTGELWRVTPSSYQFCGLMAREQQSTSECVTVLWTAESHMFSRLSRCHVTRGDMEFWGLISCIYSPSNWIFVKLNNMVAN